MTAVTPGHKGNQFNFVTSARRQPGSTFKTIALTAAVARGMDPFRTSYLSAPLHYQPDSTCNPSDPNCAWNVETYEHSYHGVESVASAPCSRTTRCSRACRSTSARRTSSRWPASSASARPARAVPSITLGSVAVTPIEMASAYATIAAGGVYSKPMAITKVVLPNGKVDTDAGWGSPTRERVIPDWVASTVTQVLEQNMLYGDRPRRARVQPHRRRQDRHDRQLRGRVVLGYTPRLMATVWIGYPQGEVPMLSVHGIAVSGPTFPAQIWHLFMDTAIGNRPDVPFPPAQTEPVWTSWRGQYQYSGAYGTSSATTGTATAGATTRSHGTTTRLSTPVTTLTPVPPTTTGAAAGDDGARDDTVRRRRPRLSPSYGAVVVVVRCVPSS